MISTPINYAEIMDLQTALRIAREGHATLFLGAGFSMGEKNIKGDFLLSSKQLAKQVADSVGLPDDTPLTLAAEIFREHNGTDPLIDLVKGSFTAASVPSNAHCKIASLPWRRVYTTNYDDLFEKASESNGDSIFSVTMSDQVRNIPKDKRTCVHLNGFVAKLDRSSIDTELKLTDSSYLQRAMLDSEWAILLRQDLRLSRAIIFIGYSLYDYEVRKLLLDIPQLSDKTVFVLGDAPNSVLVQQIQQYGTAEKLTTTATGELVAAMGSEKCIITEEHNSFLALDEFSPPSESKSPSDNDQWGLFLQGVLDPRCLHYSVASDNPYVLRRGKIEDCLASIETDNLVIAVLSELGNGKSIFLQCLQFDLSARGYKSYWVKESGDEAVRELSAVAARPGKKVFFIEGYPDRLSLVQTFAIHASPDSRLVVTARTSVHDLFSDPLTELLQGRSLTEIRLDLLDDEELEWFSKLFTKFGMWGERAAASDATKLRILRSECQGQIHGILMKLLESPQIQQRLTELLSPLTGNASYQEVLICIMIVSMLGLFITVDVLSDIVGPEAIASKEFRSNPRVRQLVGFDSFAVNIRSSIVAQFFLTRLVNKSSTLSVLVRLIRRANKGHSNFSVCAE